MASLFTEIENTALRRWHYLNVPKQLKLQNFSDCLFWARKNVEKRMLRLSCQTAFDGFFSNPITVFYVMLLEKTWFDGFFDGQKRNNVKPKQSNFCIQETD